MHDFEFDETTMTLSKTIEDDEGEETVHQFPAVFDVCDKCSGKGKHVNPNVDGHGISKEEFDEDPDFKEAYFAGAYDITCIKCDGKRVIGVINEKALSDEQASTLERLRDNDYLDKLERYNELQHGY